MSKNEKFYSFNCNIVNLHIYLSFIHILSYLFAVNTASLFTYIVRNATYSIASVVCDTCW